MERQKLSPSAFLRKGGGQLLYFKFGPVVQEEMSFKEKVYAQFLTDKDRYKEDFILYTKERSYPKYMYT